MTGKIPKRVRHQQAIEKAELYAAKNLAKYIKKLEVLAMGVLVADLKDGQEVVYRTAPDRAALQYLIDRGMGKVPTRIEVTGDEGGPVETLAWLPSYALPDPVIEGEVKELEEGSGQTTD